jgi:hypothetical protein
MFGAAFVALALVAAFGTTRAPAATYTWQGGDFADPTLWSVAANWAEAGGPPTGADSVVFDTFPFELNVDLGAGPQGAADVLFTNLVSGDAYDIQNGTLVTGAIRQDGTVASDAVSTVSAGISEFQFSAGTELNVEAGTMRLTGQLGASTLPLTAVVPAGGTSVASGATLAVTNATSEAAAKNYLDGTIAVAGTLEGIGNALDAATVELQDGGVFDITGTTQEYVEGLLRKYYTGGVAGGSGWDPWDTLAGDTPADVSVDTDGIDDSAGSLGFGQEDNYAMTWEGFIYLEAGEGGTFAIRSRADDAHRVWINDLSEGNPVLSHDGANNTQNSTYDFTGMEETYIPFRAGFQEGSGGDYMWFAWDGGTGTITDNTIADGPGDPLAGNQFWHLGEVTRPAATDTNVTLAAGASGTVAPNGEVALGSLTFNDGSTLNVAPAGNIADALSFTDTTMASGTDPVAATIDTPLDVDAGPLTLGDLDGMPNSDATVNQITKEGTGHVTFTDVKSVDTWNAALELTVNGGELALTGQVGTVTPESIITIQNTNVNAGATLSVTNYDDGDARNMINGSVNVNDGATLRFGGFENASSLGDASINLDSGKLIVEGQGGNFQEISIGDDNNRGSLSFDGSVHTIAASGTDVWGNADDMYFVYQEVPVDQPVDISAQVGIGGFNGGSNAWRKAGLMIRDSLNDNSRNAAILIAESDGNGINPQIRPTDGAGTNGGGSGAGTRVNHDTPVWLRLTYDGDGQSFDTFWSDDGITWNDNGDDAGLVMGAPIDGTYYMGMWVTSHNSGEITSTGFSDLSGFLSPIITLGNDVAITGDSEIESLAPTFLGDATLADGTNLTVTSPDGQSIGFATSTFGDGAAAAAATLNATTGDLYLGEVSDQGQALTLTKTGAGALVFDQTDFANTTANTTIDLQEGTLGVGGTTGGANPLGGAVVQMTGAGSVVVLTDKSGDYALDNAFDFDASGRLEARMFGLTGTAENATITLNNPTAGGFDIATGETLTVSTADGYTLNLDNEVSGGGTLRVESGKVTVANDGVLDGGTPLEIGPFGFVHFIVPPAGQPPIQVGDDGALGGDLAGLDLGNVDFQPGGIVVQDPATGSHPTFAQQGDCDLYLGVTDVAGTYPGIGCNEGGGDISGDGPAYEGTYRGVALDPMFATGDFTGTIGEAEQDPPTYNSSGYEVLIRDDWTFDGATFDAEAGHPITVIGEPGKLATFTTAINGTADTFIREGIAPVDGGSAGDMSSDILAFAGADVLAGGRIMTLKNGVATFATGGNNGVAADATLEIDQNATLFLTSAPANGTLVIKEGGYLRFSDQTQLTGGATFVYEDVTTDANPWVIADQDIFDWVGEGFPTDKAVNIIASAGRFDQGLFVGQNSVITLPYSENHDLRQHGATAPWSIQIHDDLKDGSVDTVRMAVAEGQTMQVHSNTDLSNDLGDADSRATLVVGYGPGETLPWLPSNGGSLNYQQVPMTGSTYFRLGEGTGGHLLGGLDVRSGEARFGDNGANNGQQAVVVDINGPVVVREGASLFLRATQTTDYTPQLEAGTWGTTQTWEKDSFVEWWVKNYTGDVRELAQAVIVGGGAADASEATHFTLDHYEQQGGSNQGPDEGYLLTDVTMQDGAYLEFQGHNTDRAARRLHLKLEGTATVAGNDFSISGEAAVPGTPVTLLVGDAAHPDPTFTLGITGPLSEDVTLLDNQAENEDHWVYDLYYGKYANGVDEDGDGDPLREEWGAGSTLEIGGRHIINVRVDEDGDGANPLNTNVFAGTVRVLNNVEPGTLPQWDEVEKNVHSLWDARIRSDRDANRGRPRQLVVFKDLVLTDGAMVITGDDDADSISDITLEGPTGYYLNNAGHDHAIRDVTGTPGSVLVVYPDNDLDMMGTITDADIMGVGDDDIHLQEGFDLNGNTLTYQLSDQLNIKTDPGAGTINIGPSMQGMTNFNGDQNGTEIFHGANNDDTIGENGWGDNLVITHAGQTRINMRSDKALAAGDQNINVLNAEIRVTDNSGGWDLDLYADSDVNAPPGESVNHFANVRIMPDDPGVNDAMPELRFRSFDQSRNRVSLVLENDVQLRAGPGGGFLLYYIGDLTDAVPDDGTEHTVYAITNGSGEQAPLDGTIGDEVVLQLDANGGGQFRITEPLNETAFGSLDLNGRTVQVARSTNGGGFIGALVVMDDAPASIGTGTILVDGGLHGGDARLAFDADHDGNGVEVDWGEEVDIIIQNTTDNDAEVEGWVDTGNVGPVQTIAQKVQIVDANANWGAHDARVDAEHRSDDGFSPGRVEFENLEFHLDARAELRASGNGNMPRLLVNPIINGRAGIVNNSSESRIFVGDVDYADGVVPADEHSDRLEAMGGQQTRFVGNVDANVVNWNWASLEDGFVVTDSGTGDTEGHFDVDGLTFLRTDIEADAITVFDGGDNVLYIDTMGATKFDPADLDLASGARLGLTVDRDLADDAWDTVDDRQARIYIGKNAYSGTLTLNDNDTEIGSDLRDNASITAPLAGAATQVTFEGGDNMLTLEAGVIDEASLGGGSPVSVQYANNVRIAGAQSHTGDAMVSADRTYMLDAGAFGSGAVISTGGTLDLQVDLANPLVFGGGGIYATGAPRSVTGALTDAGNTDPGTVTLGADDTLTFTQNLQINGPRTVDVTNGTAVFTGNLTSDTGTWTVTKAGTGSLQLDGDASGVNLTLGTSPGGTTLVGAAGTPPASVTIGHDSAYGVEQVDHDYAEVDMAASTGAIALGADTNAAITMNNTDLSLGAAGDATYSGILTPGETATAGHYKYQLGGGGATLTVAPASLADQGGDATDLAIGRDLANTYVEGLLANVYEGLGTGADFPGWAAIDAAQATLTFVDTDGINDSYSTITGSNEDNYTMAWTGFIEVHEAGTTTYVFNGNSDDQGQIEVFDPAAGGGAGAWVVVADTRDPGKFDGSVDLDPGLYAFRAGYRENAGGDNMIARWDAGLAGGFEIIDGAGDADALQNFFIRLADYPGRIIDNEGMVVLQGADATPGVGGDIDIYIAAGIEGATGGDDPFAALADANSLTIHETGSLDIGTADLGSGAALDALDVMTIAGGFTRNGGTITEDDILAFIDDVADNLWAPDTAVIGGGGGPAAVTTIGPDFDIADADAETLVKVGSNTLHLVAADQSEEDYIDYIVVDGGKVVADTQFALVFTRTVTVNHDAELQISAPYAEDDPLTSFVLNDRATLAIQGTYQAISLTLGAGADALLTGVATPVFDLDVVGAPVDGSGALTLDDGVRLMARFGGAANFHLREGAVLEFTGYTADATAGLGSMRPDALISVAPGMTAGVSGGGLAFGVDPALGAAGWSDADHPYTIEVGDGSTLTLTDALALSSAVTTDATGVESRPVAHVEKTGAGTLVIGGGNYNATAAEARTFHWNVVAGTLDATADVNALGADGYGWAFNDKRPTAAGQHLEGIEIQSGATLAWGGTHGSLPASAYGGLPAGQGDGFLPDELLLYDTATLQGDDLALGFYQEYTDPGTGALVVDTYPLYPTVVTNSATAVNLAGQIDLRSGLKLGGTEEGPLTVNVSGDVAFGNTDLMDKVGGLDVDVIDHLNVLTGGTAGIHRSHLNMQTTAVNSGANLNVDPDGAAGAPVTYAGPITNNGSVSTLSGDVTLTGNLENNGSTTLNGSSVLLQGNITNNGGITFGADTAHAAGAAFDSNGMIRAARGTTTVDAMIVSPEPDPGVIAAPSGGLLTYYSFNDTAVDSAGGHDLTLLGAAAYDVGGYVGSALSLDGTADTYAEDADGEAYINGLPGFTVAMWIKSDQTNTDRGMFIAHEPTGQDRFLAFRYDAAGASSGGTANVIKGGFSSTDVPDDGTNEIQFETVADTQTTEWQHLAMTWGSLDPNLDGDTADALGDGKLRLYIDGVETAYAWEEPRNYGGVVTDCTTVLVGNGGKGNEGQAWDGLIDETYIYNRPLSEAEIDSLMNATGTLAAGIAVDADATLILNGGFTNQGLVSVAAGGTLETLANADTLGVASAGRIIVGPAAALAIETSFLQYDDPTNTLSGGEWLVRGSLVAPEGTDIQTIGPGADLTLDGPVSAVEAFVDGGPNDDALADLGRVDGALRFTGGRDWTSSGNLDNYGTVHVGGGSTVTIDGDFSAFTGSTNTVHGELVLGVNSWNLAEAPVTGNGTGVLTLGNGAVLDVDAGGLHDLATINLGTDSELNVNADSTGIGTIQGASGTVNVATTDAQVGVFNTLDTVAVNDGATLTMTTEADNTTANLSLSGTGTLNLHQANLVVDYDPSPNPYDDVAEAVKNAWNSGTWDASGITCDGDANTYALGVADNNDPDFATRPHLEDDTVPVDPTSVLVRYTFYGNANLDDRVDAADLSKLLGNFGTILPNPDDIMGWFLGNFNYDDRVDAADLSKLLGNWGEIEGAGGLSDGPAPVGGGVPTPEPATLALLALGAGAMLARRRRSR